MKRIINAVMVGLIGGVIFGGIGVLAGFLWWTAVHHGPMLAAGYLAVISFVILTVTAYFGDAP